jgi:hypothetical protein
MPLSAEDRATYRGEIAVLEERRRHVENHVNLSGFGMVVGSLGLLATIFGTMPGLGPALAILGVFCAVAFIDRRRYRDDLDQRIARIERTLRTL